MSLSLECDQSTITPLDSPAALPLPDPFLVSPVLNSAKAAGKFVLSTASQPQEPISESPLQFLPGGVTVHPTTPESLLPAMARARSSKTFQRGCAIILSPLGAVNFTSPTKTKKATSPSWIERAFVKPVTIGSGQFWRSTHTADLGIPTFDPQNLESYLLLRRKLDAFQNAGVSEHQFQAIFSQCCRCCRFMTRRSQEYHKCPEDPASLGISFDRDMLHLRLDCYSGGSGVSVVQFQEMFAQCIYCELFMTEWAARHHECDGQEEI